MSKIPRLLEEHTQSTNQDFRKISQDGKQSRKFKIMKQVIVDYIPFEIIFYESFSIIRK